MNIDWSDLLSAIALVMIIEGLLPFASPRRLRETYAQIQKMSDKTLRSIGFASVFLGLILLLLAR